MMWQCVFVMRCSSWDVCCEIFVAVCFVMRCLSWNVCCEIFVAVCFCHEVFIMGCLL